MQMGIFRLLDLEDREVCHGLPGPKWQAAPRA